LICNQKDESKSRIISSRNWPPNYPLDSDYYVSTFRWTD